MAHNREFAEKPRMARRFNTKVRPRIFQEGGMVLKRVIDTKKKGKLSLIREGPY